MKPRNHNIVAMLKRKQGAHGKSFKAMRRKEKVDFKGRIAQLVEQ